MITIRNTGAVTSPATTDITQAEQAGNGDRTASVSTRPAGPAVASAPAPGANDTVPAQLRGVVPHPKRTLESDVLLRIVEKLVAASHGVSAAADAKEHVAIQERLAAFLTLRHKAESGQGGATLVNWIRDFDIPVAGEREMNGALLCAATKTSLQSQEITDIFNSFADQMCEELEAKGVDSLEAAAIAVVSAQVHQSTLLAAALSNPDDAGASPATKQISALIQNVVADVQTILNENIVET